MLKKYIGHFKLLNFNLEQRIISIHFSDIVGNIKQNLLIIELTSNKLFYLTFHTFPIA